MTAAAANSFVIARSLKRGRVTRLVKDDTNVGDGGGLDHDAGGGGGGHLALAARAIPLCLSPTEGEPFFLWGLLLLLRGLQIREAIALPE